MAEPRTELKAAREAAGYSQQGLANKIGAERTSVIRWEKGEVNPQPALRARLRDALKVTDAEMTRLLLGTATAPPPEGMDMDRRQLLGGLGLSVGAAMLGGEGPATPVRVGRAEIELVRTAATTLATWDHTYGGGLPTETVDAQLQWSAGLLHADVPRSLRPDLFSAVGYFAGVAGFAAFDSYHHDRARSLFAFAQGCAEEVGDWHLRARALGMAARQAIWVGDADTGLTHTELALVRSDRLTPTEAASLHTLRARALARLGRTEDALAAAGDADHAFARRSKGDADPPWMGHYDDAQHRGDTGHALADATRAGVRTDAAERLAYSTVHHPEAQTRSRVMSHIELASLSLSTGEPEAAASAVGAALVHVGELRSARAVDTLQRVHRQARALPAGRAVGELVDVLDDHFEASA